MLPKVATQLLHSTVTRGAAAAVQNQANLRNVLQLHPSAPGASSSSSSPVSPPYFTSANLNVATGSLVAGATSSAVSKARVKANAHGGSNGPHSGGAKDKAGQRFYTGYNGASRAVTQANALTTHDAPTVQLDESEDLHPAARRALLKKKASSTPKRTRLRSSSVNALLPRKEPALISAEKVPTGSVLKTVQLQARSFHALTAAQQQSQGSQTGKPIDSAPAVEDVAVELEQPEPALRPRRNSTSSVDGAAQVPLPESPALSATELEHEEARSASPLSESSSRVSEESAPTTAPPASPTPSKPSVYITQFANALSEKDAVGVEHLVAKMIRSDLEFTTADVNAALEAIGATRQENTPLSLTLELYNNMLARSVRPNIRTYVLLIDQFATRDWEVQRLTHMLERGTKNRRWMQGAFAKQIPQMQSENNFSSAMKLFEAIVSIGGNSQIPIPVYKRLMRSCGGHGNVDGALSILTQVEKRVYKPDPDLYRFLLMAFAGKSDFQGAELVFQKYRKMEADGQFASMKSPMIKMMQVAMWNQMMEVYFKKGEPEKAIGLLEEMLKNAPEASIEDGAVQSHSPLPSNATFTTIIQGFISTGDLSSALSWFDKLLQQSTDASELESPFAALERGLPSKPDQLTCFIMLDALIKAGDVPTVNRIISSLPSSRWFELREDVLQANLADAAQLDKATLSERLDWVNKHYMPPSVYNSNAHYAAYGLVDGYIRVGRLAAAVDVVASLQSSLGEVVLGEEGIQENIRNLALKVAEGSSMALNSEAEGLEWSLESALKLAKLEVENLNLAVMPLQGYWLLDAYGRAKNASGVPELDLGSWKILLVAAANLENSTLARSAHFAFQGLPSLLADMSSRSIQLTEEFCDAELRRAVIELAARGKTMEESRAFFGSLGGNYQAEFELLAQAHLERMQRDLDAAKQQEEQQQVFANVEELASPAHSTHFIANLEQAAHLTKELEGILANHTLSANEKADKGYKLFHDAITKGSKVPHATSIGKLIQVCGRINQQDRVNELYRLGQMTVSSLKGRMTAARRNEIWATLEDNMIIGLAHSGDVEGAHAHRKRILDFAHEVGQPSIRPSADAYGALILNVKETTDDASNALWLWNEAIQVGVQPNLYLYNNIISKLARARKVEQALELFHHMRANGVKPSSITYGAVIGACVRVGDAAAAEGWFKEMMEQKGFKARVPPFNTMIQMYTTTKPDKARALWYFEEMIRRGVKPTGHTYKLLLDAHGSVEPIDLEGLHRVWSQLVADQSVAVNGSHFASLINAYGCVLKDLPKAIEIFEAIPNEYGVARDAVVYESLVNALVANKRTDLIREFMARMIVDGVHMTAYVANFLIKGWANVGDVEQARVIFESMLDPPTGVAAPNNHAPHEPSEVKTVGVLDPVYREPSTWEAMIRAELGCGNRDRAVALLERLRARQYPEAVFNRISGVLVDHSIPA